MVTCQLSRLRLLPTTQAMNAHDTRGRKTTEVSEMHFLNAQSPISIKLSGSARDVRQEQPWNACSAIEVKVFGSVTEARLKQE